METHPEDVPSPHDFHDPDAARAWVERTQRERPYRVALMDRMAEEIGRLGRDVEVVELGSGPGLLAERLIAACPRIRSYALLDSSPPMLRMSEDRLRGAAIPLRFLLLDFREAGWTASAGPADVVVSMQAVHELRHKWRAPALYRQVASICRPGGLVLICDHLPGDAADERRTALYMTEEEQLAALREGGLRAPEVVMELNGLVLYRAEL